MKPVVLATFAPDGEKRRARSDIVGAAAKARFWPERDGSSREGHLGRAAPSPFEGPARRLESSEPPERTSCRCGRCLNVVSCDAGGSGRTCAGVERGEALGAKASSAEPTERFVGLRDSRAGPARKFTPTAGPQPTGMLRGANVSHTLVFPNSQGYLMEQFSSELIAILGVGATMLGGGIAVIRLVLQQGRRIDRRIDGLAQRMDERDRRTDDRFGQINEQYRQLTDQMNERFRQLTDQMNEQFRQMNEQFQMLSERVARVEGKFDLLEAFVEHRKEPPAEAAE